MVRQDRLSSIDKLSMKMCQMQGRTKEEVICLLENPADNDLQKGNGYAAKGHLLTASDEAQFVISHVEETGPG